MEEPDPKEAPKINAEGARRIDPPNQKLGPGEVPNSVQNEFYGFISGHIEATPQDRLVAAHAKYLPELLDVVKKDFQELEVIERRYWSYKGNRNFSRRAEAFFNKRKGEPYSLYHVNKYGEHSCERTSISFPDKGRPGLELQTNRTGMKNTPDHLDGVRIRYDENGNLIGFFGPSDDAKGWDDDWQISFRILKTARGTMESGFRNIDVTYTRGEDFVKIYFVEDDRTITRSLEIPIRVDWKAVRDKLTPSAYFSDPYNVLPDDDHHWLEADLEKTIGIKEEPSHQAK